MLHLPPMKPASFVPYAVCPNSTELRTVAAHSTRPALKRHEQTAPHRMMSLPRWHFSGGCSLNSWRHLHLLRLSLLRLQPLVLQDCKQPPPPSMTSSICLRTFKTPSFIPGEGRGVACLGHYGAPHTELAVRANIKGRLRRGTRAFCYGFAWASFAVLH